MLQPRHSAPQSVGNEITSGASMHTLPLHKISYVKIEADSDTRSNRLPSCLATKGPTDSGGILARSLRSAPAYEIALYDWLNFGKTKEITKNEELNLTRICCYGIFGFR